ncbi:DUF4270 domain-containing protein [Aquimarina sp. TRL1]|uniref:DUF4270 domain-containing protein n=1 Tax=Aquimarina sp. (strain TRL1) TaxID=2736252 RepID=UPI00158B7549|nr:DUF4270 domain-containing protein [Aquimarina sp. TRL1]QKX04522.1 DUF4270 domain-containing protein [Aquimarina sp. TRL1]
MNWNNSFKKLTTFVVVLSSVLVSCDDEFSTVGSNIIGDVNFNDSSYTAIPKAYSKRFERVQVNNLPNNLLGVYEDTYGTSTYTVLSQMQLGTQNPTFGTNAELDSVVLTIPYFSTETESTTNDEGEVEKKYRLDSLYGTDPVKLSVYQSNYFLSSFETNGSPDDRKVYYADDIKANKTLIEGTLLAEQAVFYPQKDEVILRVKDGDDEGDELDVVRQAPRLRLKLSKEYFKTLILDKEGMPELSNSNNFNNYFRGVYFKVAPINGKGSLLQFNINQADITLYYTYDKEQTTNGETTTVQEDKEFKLNFGNSGIILNGIENDFTEGILVGESVVDGLIDGEDNLFLKGGQGSYGILEFFMGIAKDAEGNEITNGAGEPMTELEYLKEQEWLINEANIKLYINQDKINSGEAEPERVFVFDADTGAVLVDYIADRTNNDNNPVNSRISHLGRITRDTDDKGEYYKIRITQHIINLLNGDTENIKLGISVSQNVNERSIRDASVTPTSPEDQKDIVPSSSLISHEGTVLYGYGENVPDDKQLKLEIFYTAAKTN